MADVSHELGALRFVVDSPLSSKVAMFNNQATQHKQAQLLNPFSHDGRASSPKPTFSKDQYGKPLAGSLTEMRGQKANMHVMKEMLELCQIIDSEGYQVKDEPNMRVIPFGELFNIYNYISDKVVGILLRARKHKLLEFEGEMLFQRQDDDVPIFLLRPIVEIRHELNAKIEEIKRGASPAPQSTSVILDRSAHEHNLKVQQGQTRQSKSRTPSPGLKSKSKSTSPAPKVADKPDEAPPATLAAEPAATASIAAAATKETSAAAATPAAAPPTVVIDQPPEALVATVEVTPVPAATIEQVEPAAAPAESSSTTAVETQPETVQAPTQALEAAAPAATTVAPAENTVPVSADASSELPTIVIEASATFVRSVSVEQHEEQPVPSAAAEATAESA